MRRRLAQSCSGAGTRREAMRLLSVQEWKQVAKGKG